MAPYNSYVTKSGGSGHWIYGSVFQIHEGSASKTDPGLLETSQQLLIWFQAFGSESALPVNESRYQQPHTRGFQINSVNLLGFWPRF